MFSLNYHYSDFPQQQTFFPNLHSSSPCNDEKFNPNFHHQNYHSNQIFLPQTLVQDPNIHMTPTNFPYNPSSNQASLGLQSSPKKDRHTKISTAHGFRDRRVRLSMAIAREFFDLQDMLGFDKASKTIGWLLAKSKNAIQELALENPGSGLSRSNSSSSSSQQQVIRRRKMRKRLSANYSEEEIENQANAFVAKQNRAKARARARERTKGKLSTLIEPNQFDDLGFQNRCSSQFLTDFKAQDFSRSPHLIEKEGFSAPLQNVSGLDVIRSRHSSPSMSCTDYFQSLLSTADQDASVRANYIPNLLFESNYNPEASFSGWNVYPHFPNW